MSFAAHARALVLAYGREFAFDPGGLLRSTDGGRSWTEVKTGLETEPYPPRLYALTSAPSAPGTIYLAAEGFDTTRILRSTDGGSTWTVVATFSEHPVPEAVTLAVHPSDPQIVFMAYGSSVLRGTVILRSTDGGTTWPLLKQLAVDGGPVDLVIDPVAPSTFYLALSRGIPGGSLDPESPQKIEGQIYRSLDGGANWTQVPTPSSKPFWPAPGRCATKIRSRCFILHGSPSGPPGS